MGAMQNSVLRVVRRETPRIQHHTADLERELQRRAIELEEGLLEIDFEEVTAEDRITFVEHAVAWQVRLALHARRFDLAVALQRLGVERIARLHEQHYGWRPVLLYGVPPPARDS